jgi:hypothetical protein
MSNLLDLILNDGIKPVIEETRLSVEVFNELKLNPSNPDDKAQIDLFAGSIMERCDRISKTAIDAADKINDCVDSFKHEMQSLHDSILNAPAANHEHQRKINREALDSMVAEGYSEDEAKAFLKLIIGKKIKNVSVNY